MGARKSARFTLRFKLESQFQPWRVAWGIPRPLLTHSLTVAKP